MKKEETNTISEPCWFAIYTRSRAEKKVLEQLEKAGIRAYLPQRRELRQWSDRKKWVEVPAINSYLFLQLLPNELSKVYNVPGFVAYVNDKGRPAIIPSNQMEAMQKAVDSKTNFTIEQSSFQKGDWIRMTSGTLTGVEGKISSIRGKNKLCIEITPIGFTMVVDMDDSSYIKIEEPVESNWDSNTKL